MFSIYGANYCLNIVAGEKGKPEAVLIRAGEPIDGIEILKTNRKSKSTKTRDLSNGPGKLGHALQIDKSFNGYDMCKPDSNEMYLVENPFLGKIEIEESKRINIDYAEEWKDKLWRFTIKGNEFVSKAK